MPYGYTGQNLINQTVKNSGVFSISDVADLEKQGKFGGSLELIQEQSATSGDAIDFTDLKDYKVHIAQFYDLQASGSTDLRIRVSNDGGSTYNSTANDYTYAHYLSSNAVYQNINSITSSFFRVGNRVANNRPSNGFVYFYNLLDSSLYSSITYHTASRDTDANASNRLSFGGGTYINAETINALRFYISSAYAFNGTGKIRLFGLKEL